MAGDRGSTVLVTGGSGFLGGWCVIELLRRGYAVRTTVRSLSREPQVRAAVGSEVDPGDRLTVLAADLTSDEGWAEAVEGCDYVLHVASPFPPKQPKDPDELIVPAREGTLRVLRAGLDAGVKRVVVTSSVAAIRLSDGAAAGRSTRATGPTPTPRADALRSLEDDRRAGGLGPGARARRGGPPGGGQPRRDHRAGAERRPLLLPAGGPAAARRECPGCRGSASAWSTSATSPTSRSGR